jgi:hypothetical protein
MSTGLMERRQTTTAIRAWKQEDIIEPAPDEDGAWDDAREVTASRSALDLLSPLDTESPARDRGMRVRKDGDRRTFEQLADELAQALRGLSSTRLAYGHPAYAEIMAMGDRTVPWLLERLEMPGDRPVWLRLLGSLTRFQPGAGKESIPEAAAAWIAWGRLRHDSR